LTRREFEEMIAPSLRQTIAAVRRMLEQAGVEPTELAGVLLVGGTSRIPLIAEVVSAELDVPCRVDAHPKLVVARGAARWAATDPQLRGAVTAEAGRRRRPVVVGAIAAGAVGAVALGVLAITQAADGGGQTEGGDPSTTLLSPPTDSAVPTSGAPSTTTGETPVPSTVLLPSLSIEPPISTPAFPDTIAFDGQQLWVTITTDGQLARLDRESGAVLDAMDVGPDPVDVAFGHGALWVTVRDQNAVLRIDPQSRAITRIEIGQRTGNVAIGNDAVWVTMVEAGLVRIDPTSLSPQLLDVPIPQPGGLFVTDDSVWVAQRQDDVVVRIDPASLAAVGTPIAVGADPDPVAELDGILWVGNRGEDTVSRIDLTTGEQIVERVATAPADIAIDGQRVWVVCADGGTLELLDGSDASRLLTQQLGGRPLSVLSLDDALWIALAEARQVVKVVVDAS
jgi:streptogramin lyase